MMCMGCPGGLDVALQCALGASGDVLGVDLAGSDYPGSESGCPVGGPGFPGK